MNKIVTLILLVISTTYSQNQVEKFKLSPEGFPDYVVLEFDDKSTSDIFNSLKKWAEYNLRNADYSNYSEVENEYLTYTFIDNNAVETGTGLSHFVFSIEYDVELRIKDNRLRIDVILKEMPMVNPSHGSPLTLTSSANAWPLFKKNGDIRNRKSASEAIPQIESSANNIVQSFYNAIIGKVDYKKTDW